MTDAPKLLTEEEWRANLRVWVNIAATDAIILLMRYHDLIAPEPEPVDPLLDEAREIAASCYEDDGFTNYVRQIREGYKDHGVGVRIALAALRRNLELAERPTLTREMVREAMQDVYEKLGASAWNADAFHSAIVKQLNNKEL